MLRNLQSSGAFVRVLEKTATKTPRCEVGEIRYVTPGIGPFLCQLFTVSVRQKKRVKQKEHR